MEFSASTSLSNWSVAPKNGFPIFLLAIPFLAHSGLWKRTILNTYQTPFLLKWDREYRIKRFVSVIIRYTALSAPSCQKRETYLLLDRRAIRDAPFLNSCLQYLLPAAEKIQQDWEIWNHAEKHSKKKIHLWWWYCCGAWRWCISWCFQWLNWRPLFTYN